MTVSRILLVCLSLSVSLFSSQLLAASCIKDQPIDPLIAKIKEAKPVEVAKEVSKLMNPDFVSKIGKEKVDSTVTGHTKFVLEKVVEKPPLNPKHSRDIASSIRNGMIRACASLETGGTVGDAIEAANSVLAARGGGSEYHLLLGVSQTLEQPGSYKSGNEATFRSSTVHEWKNKRRRTTLELTFRDLDVPADEMVAEGGAEDQPASPDPTPNPAPAPEEPVLMEDPTTINATELFNVKQGELRINMSLDSGYADKERDKGLGFRVGTGFTSVSFDDDGAVMRNRIFFGPVFRAEYGTLPSGKPSTGELFFGIANDESWRYPVSASIDGVTRFKEQERVVIDGRMDVPSFFSSSNVRLHTRLFADMPLSGKGPSDVRISLQFNIDLGRIFSFAVAN